MKIFSLPVLSILFFTSVLAFAGDDGLDARTSIKVNRAKRHQSMDKNDNSNFAKSSNQQKSDVDPCKGVEIGNVYTDGNRVSVPRENTVVVTGDVINIPSNSCR